MTGIPSRLVTWRVASTPMGSNAGPLTPPDPLASRRSRKPGIVFTSVTASAPSSWATRAIATTSGSTGESFTEIGLVAAARQRRTSARSPSGVAPNSRPPALVLGQDALISNAAIAVRSVSPAITAT